MLALFGEPQVFTGVLCRTCQTHRICPTDRWPRIKGENFTS